MRPTAKCSRLNRQGETGDGGYVMCDDLPVLGGSDCLVYSFGIKDIFGFENEAAARGCTVHGYDPTVRKHPSMHFDFHRLGLSDARKQLPGVGPVASLDTILADNGHKQRQLTLFKCDIESAEWEALRVMSDEALSRFSNVLIELHLTSARYAAGASKPWPQMVASKPARPQSQQVLKPWPALLSFVPFF